MMRITLRVTLSTSLAFSSAGETYSSITSVGSVPTYSISTEGIVSPSGVVGAVDGVGVAPASAVSDVSSVSVVSDTSSVSVVSLCLSQKLQSQNSGKVLWGLCYLQDPDSRSQDDIQRVRRYRSNLHRKRNPVLNRPLPIRIRERRIRTRHVPAQL